VAGEILCLRLLSLHNLHWYGELVAGARAAIERREYTAWTADVLSGMDAETGEA
jgi:queuine/archaeosine tRNA-ribosyltransferase